MQFVAHRPAPPLAEHIEMLWLSEGYAPAHAKERLLPTGVMELIVDLRDDTSPDPPTLIVGAHSQVSVLDTSRPMSVMGAHFRPGGAFPFLRLPAGELHNLDVALEDLWGAQRAHDLRDQLVESPTATAKFAVLERALNEQLSHSRTAHPAVTFAIEAFARRTTVGEVAGQIGLSQHSFIGAFARQVGLTPKLYCRVQRFQRVLRRIQPMTEVDWASVALSGGYFDQPHFIRDFRAFSGLSPTEYFALRTEHLSHVPILG